MKLIHLADLHIGKKVNEFSMLEDQKYILNQVLDMIDKIQPDAVMIAGDVYDKPIPPTEAVELFDSFLYRLSKRKLQVFIISGNHDSPERLAFGNRLIDESGIHISPVFNGKVKIHSLKDEYGNVNIFMLPFLKRAQVKRFYPDKEIKSYTDALRAVIDEIDINPSERNIIITHQFVTGAQTSDSEELSVGGTDNVDASVFNQFDYVALGHLHRPQKIGSEKIRYSGTPLKYSFSEAKDKKSLSLVEMKEKGNISITELPFTPKHEMVEIRGTYDELVSKKFYENTTLQEDYIHITLTDEQDIPDAISKLRVIYHNLMKLDYDNTRTRHQGQINGVADVETKSPLELFNEFYEKQNGTFMNEEQTNYVKDLIEKIWEDAQ